MPICYPTTAIPAEGWPGEATEVQQEIALSLAWSTLHQLRAYQISICPVVVRPCAKGCAQSLYIPAPVDGPAGSPFWPVMVPGGDIINMLPCSCSSDCSCSAPSEVLLPGPVGGVVEVTLDGEVLDASAYRVDHGYKLVRQDGESWPRCQDMSVPAGEENTFTVKYHRGAVPDVLDNYAAGVLALEYLKGIIGDKSCRLPKGTTQVVRQGVTYVIDQDWFRDGHTGISEVDPIIARRNPFNKKAPPVVFSPDVATPRLTTSGA